MLNRFRAAFESLEERRVFSGIGVQLEGDALGLLDDDGHLIRQLESVQSIVIAAPVADPDSPETVEPPGGTRPLAKSLSRPSTPLRRIAAEAARP